MGMIKTRWLWAFVGRRSYGFKPGRSFGFVLFPRPAQVGEATQVPGLIRMDGWIDWLTFHTRWSFGK